MGPFAISSDQSFIFLTDLVIYHPLSNTEVRFNFSIQFQLKWFVGCEGIFLVAGFKGISAISVGDIGVFGLMAITFTEFTGLVMCQSLIVIRCGLGAEISSFTFLNQV